MGMIVNEMRRLGNVYERAERILTAVNGNPFVPTVCLKWTSDMYFHYQYLLVTCEEYSPSPDCLLGVVTLLDMILGSEKRSRQEIERVNAERGLSLSLDE
jgi:hypothetical protein